MEITTTNGGARKALALFHNAAARVPAYKDFLKRNGVRPSHIKTAQDFASVPITDAKNYIEAYAPNEKCWDGKMASSAIIATSSGTTGEQKFWPRGEAQEKEAAMVHEWLYRNYFEIHRRSTLVLIGFPMGIYISGVATLLPSWLTALKKYSMTVMSVGNNKQELLRAVRNLSGMYDQTVLIGHPFFIKDVIETGAREGIGWKKKNLGLMFCSGDFNEAWREYVGKQAGIAPSSMRIFNTYGSSEMLLMAYETPFSIGVKRLTERNPRFLSALTGETLPPQWFQYDPALRYIESLGHELVFTSASGIPLVRFNIHDRGDVFPLSRVSGAIAEAGIRAKLPNNTASRLPLVALWGRSDDTLKFHGVNLYPEHVKAGLGKGRFLRLLTGKFVMQKLLTGRTMDQAWEINIELRPDIKPSKHLADEIRASVTNTLLNVNLEYADMIAHIKKEVHPRIALWPYQHPTHFKLGVKPRYIDKSNP